MQEIIFLGIRNCNNVVNSESSAIATNPDFAMNFR